MSLNALATAAGVAALSVAGVTIKDDDEITNIIPVRDCPVLIPAPDRWLAGSLGETGPRTFGPGMWEFSRDFEYLYLHATTGVKRSSSDYIAALSANVDAILTALTGLNVSGADVEQIACTGIVEITDPAKNSFYGCQITLTMKERVNA